MRMNFGNNKLTNILCILFCLPSVLNAQIDGANVFGTDQVLTIELTFTQADFWDSLEFYYDTETYMSADVEITDNTGVYTFPDIGIRLKGNSSYGHPGDKKSFKIDFNRYVLGQNYDGLKKLNFNNSFKDPSFMHEKIFLDMCQDVGIPAPRANYANVYMNGQHWGFYSLVEQIDDQFLDWAIEDDDGNLFKAGDNFGGTGAAADLMDYGTSQASYADRYELKTNEDVNDWADLIELIDFINNSSDTDFKDQLNTHFDKANLLRAIAMDNLFSSLDTYLNSARNYYIYHNETTGQWEWIKWDANETFGLYTGGPGVGNLEQLAPDYIANDRPLVQRIFDDSELYHHYLLEVCDIMNNYFNETYVNAKADALKDLIDSYVYADANKQYTDANFDANIEGNVSVGGGPMGGGTIYGVKSFVANRVQYLYPLIDCETIGVNEFDLSEVEIYPNPFNETITLNGEHLNYAQVTVRNILGQEVPFEIDQLNESTMNCVISGPKGVYFLSLMLEGQQSVFKLKKQ